MCWHGSPQRPSVPTYSLQKGPQLHHATLTQGSPWTWFLPISPALISHLSNREYHKNNLLELLSGFNEMKHKMLSHTCPMVNLDKRLLKCLVTFESFVLHDQTLISFYRGALLSEDTFPTSRSHLTEGAYAYLQEIFAGLMEKAASFPSCSQSDKEIYPTDENRQGACLGRFQEL